MVSKIWFMICDSPIRIRNKYTGQWMYVPCRHCDSCLIERANIMSMHLSNYMERFTYSYMITLTYDNYHLPIIVTGRSGIYRLLDDNGEIGDLPYLVEDTEDTFDFDGANYTPTNYPIHYGCCGVLYYPDVQKFFKRFRINYLRDYGKKAEIKFYLCGEYGGNMRPHYHIIILSDTARFDEIRNLTFKSWTLCDWSKLDLDESVKQTNLGGVAGYVSSYVNCMSNCDELFRLKSIKPFTHRSKDLNFGTDREMEEQVVQFVKREDNRGFSQPYCRFFQKVDVRQISLPLVTLSSKFLLSYFSKPRGFSGLSVNSQCRCLAKVLRIYLTNQIIANLGISPLSKYQFFNSSDYRTFLSYRRFCLLLNLNPFLDGSIEIYISVFLDVHSYYSSIKLSDSMNVIKTRGFKQYLLDCNQSYVENLDKRNFRMTWKTGLHNVCFHDWFESSFSRNKRLSYRQRYAKKLLPKHINESFGNFNISCYV